MHTRTLGRRSRDAQRVIGGLSLAAAAAAATLTPLSAHADKSLAAQLKQLQQRMQQFFERIETTLRQCLRTVPGADSSATPTADANVRSSVLMSFLIGRLQRFARSDFRKLPTEQLDACLALMAH